MDPLTATRALAGALFRDAVAGRPPRAGPRLVRLDDPAAPAPLVDGATIGRGRGAALRVVAPEISRVHARVVAGAAGFAVEDAGSKNGLRVNGRPVRGRAPLAEGDVLEVGPARLRVEGLRERGPEPRRARTRRLPAALLLLAAALALLATS